MRAVGAGALEEEEEPLTKHGALDVADRSRSTGRADRGR
jgi:hypothetical protein